MNRNVVNMEIKGWKCGIASINDFGRIGNIRRISTLNELIDYVESSNCITEDFTDKCIVLYNDIIQPSYWEKQSNGRLSLGCITLDSLIAKKVVFELFTGVITRLIHKIPFTYLCTVHYSQDRLSIGTYFTSSPDIRSVYFRRSFSKWIDEPCIVATHYIKCIISRIVYDELKIIPKINLILSNANVPIDGKTPFWDSSLESKEFVFEIIRI